MYIIRSHTCAHLSRLELPIFPAIGFIKCETRYCFVPEMHKVRVTIRPSGIVPDFRICHGHPGRSAFLESVVNGLFSLVGDKG